MSTENDLVAKCPQCGSLFRLTPQHLQAAKGWVQCGMCGNVFHSGMNPPEEQTAAPQETQGTEAPTAPEESNATADASQPEEGQGATAGLSGLAQRMAEEQGVPSAFGPKLESIILVDPNLPHADDDYGPMPTFEAREEETPKPEAPATAAYQPATPPTAGWGARQSTATSTGWIPRRPSAAAGRAARQQPKRRLGWLWALLILLLLAGLVAQTVYSMRDKLAASYPEIRPSLGAICKDLNCTISLPRDPHQVTILGHDLQTENQALLLEVTLANRASYSMAWPVLELTLTDVEDQPLARRMFAPSEYLASGSRETAGIQARSEVPIKLHLQSKGIKAAGYRLRMFY